MPVKLLRKAIPIAASVATVALRVPPVDVIITAHNYGQFLRECLDSVLCQESLASVVVVDDASDDGTAEIVDSYASQGVQYRRIEAHDVCSARYTGLHCGDAPFVLFLDADNKLAPGYLREAAKQLAVNERVGIVACDLQCFGAEEHLVRLAERYSAAALRRQNCLDTGAVCRRTALIQSRAIRPHTGQNMLTAEDWVMWRRLLDSGAWQVAANSIPLLYRRHGPCLSLTRMAKIHNSARPWYDDYGLAHEEVTIFTTYSNRLTKDPMLWARRLQWLQQQTWPALQTRLVVANTSWRALSVSDLGLDSLSHFAGVSVYRHDVGTCGLEDVNRRNVVVEKEVQHAVAAIYNRMFREVNTDFVMVFEDDVFPDEFDIIERLLSSFDWRTYAVSGAYRQRYTDAWSSYDRDRLLSPAHLHKERGEGVQVVGGTGFGCLMLRKSQCEGDVFVACEGASRYYDVNWFHTKLVEQPDRVCKLDWSIVCDHVGERFFA